MGYAMAASGRMQYDYKQTKARKANSDVFISNIAPCMSIILKRYRMRHTKDHTSTLLASLGIYYMKRCNTPPRSLNPT